MQKCPGLPRCDQRTGEDNRVKGNVVFADELDQLHLLGILPPLLPLVGKIGRDGDIADRGIEPDVKNLVLEVLFWNRDAPLQIPRDGPFVQAVPDPGLGHLDGILGPGALRRGLLHPGFQLRQYRRQIDIQVGGFPYHRNSTAYPAAGFHQVRWIEELAAVFALVSASFRVIAVGTDPADVAVRQKAFAGLAVGLFDGFFLDIAIAVQTEKDRLGDLGMPGS